MVDAKPFLKWAGGKTRLIPEIVKRLPILDDKTYIEPFIGAGSVMFYLMQNYNIRKAIISDTNEVLMDCYGTIKNNPFILIKILHKLQTDFYALKTIEDKTKFYIEQRDIFNSKVEINKASALLIFLNKTCFNGLYRVNKNGIFNVSYNKSLTPTICDEANILACSKVLQNVDMRLGDYEIMLLNSVPNKFYYLDPPYRPISDTSSFTAYNQTLFGDSEQIRLKEFVSVLGADWLLSNSDDGIYFDELYRGYNIQRVMNKRMINSKGDKRGEISEVLISNY